MLPCLLIVLGALLFAGAGHAAAAQRSIAPQWTMTVPHGAVAYSDGPLTVARHARRKRPVAYADGLLTVARQHQHQHRRRILAHAA